ncbi:unnamed protein product [Ixodes hexagonus]
MANEDFQRHYRLSKNVVRWLCDEIRGDPALRRQRRARTVMTVERQVLCALRFYATGGFQGLVASDRNIGVHQTSVSRAVRAVSTAIVRRLARQWNAFPATAEEQATSRDAFSASVLCPELSAASTAPSSPSGARPSSTPL